MTLQITAEHAFGVAMKTSLWDAVIHVEGSELKISMTRNADSLIARYLLTFPRTIHYKTQQSN